MNCWKTAGPISFAVAAGIVLAAACYASCGPRERPDAGLPVRPGRFKAKELGPTVKDVIRNIESRLPAEERSPDDVLEPVR